MVPSTLSDQLAALGLTPTESAVYVFLLQNPAVTGYRVARGIGKPTANAYQALESLRTKGGATVAEGRKRAYRAVPAGEFLDALAWRFDERRRRAARALAALGPTPATSGVYAMHRPEEVLTRAARLVEATKETLVLDLSAAALAHLRATIEDAISRGVRVGLATPASDPPEATLAVAFEAAQQQGEWILASADKREALIARLSPGLVAVEEAACTESAFLATRLHRALAGDLFFRALAHAAEDGLGVDEVEGLLERCREIREAG
jgi:sugar-specific transcriptional regulator TrmB